ncbi:MAG: hypothetical protein IPG10_00260 [Flavobacteriales bacterium]|nr:hypothetical protein [Flavobacteriales bacterium]MBK6755636.1 hypothetical protein [Flavobacteriales bacterium]MBK7271505.1 hypothetical protein [Flavobacteriales bacterium]MBK9076908.1 hypothetical protein [Flavobacteriales bacterium]MBK9538328.1 hypothetical protein [Flavobacteriales bacterium]
MKDHQKKRVSGTYWERFLYVALPIPLLALLFFILKNGLTSSWEVALILVAVVLMVWIVDCAPARQREPVDLFDGEWLLIDNDLVAPSAIQSITPLRRYKWGTQLIEITYALNANTRSVNVLSKPDLAPFGLFSLTPKTLRIILSNHPELQQRVRPERTI